MTSDSKKSQPERDKTDESLRTERGNADQALREKTDESLRTERARSNDALAHRDDFLGMVSHDLRNLLSGIVLNATLLGEDVRESDDSRRDTVKRIRRYSARMNRLIGDLGDVTSIDAGKLAIEPTRGDLVPLLVEAVEIFAHAAAERAITIESTTVETSLPADFDHERLMQVLANLITNALNFTPKGGRITVHGERAGDLLRVTVKDTGAGIPDDMLAAVFERFWQVSKTAQRGLGLGLYISRCIIDGHAGKIWVESKLGEGSAFHFTLPG